MSLNQIPDFMLSDEAGSVKDKIAVLSGVGGVVEKVNKSEFDLYKADNATQLALKENTSDINSKLSDIGISQINKNKGLLDQTFMSPELLAQIAGTAAINAIPAFESIVKDQLVNKVVTYEKVAFMELSVNLFDKDDVTDGLAVSSTLGHLYASANDSASNYIRVDENTQYTLNYKRPCAFYDVSKTFISGEGTSNNSVMTITTPVNAKFIRLTIETSKKSLLQFEKGSSATTYQEHYALFDGKHLKVGTVQDSVITGKIGKLRLKNMFNKTTATVSKKIDGTNGNVIDSSSYYASDWIDVIPDTTYVKPTAPNYAFYNFVKGYIGGTNTTSSQAITTPSNCYYIRISIPLAEIDTAMVVLGNTYPSKYASYGYEVYAEDGIQIIGEIIKRWEDKNWYVIGDSITYSNGYQPLVKTLCAFATVTTDAVAGQLLGTMVDRVTSLALANIDVVTVHCTTNDYKNTIIGTMADDKTVASFYGNVKKAIDTILTAKPTVRLAFIISHRVGNNAFFPVYPGPNPLGLYQKDYGNAVKEVCSYYGIPVLDMYSESGINEFTFTQYLLDNVHPNANGYILYASQISRFLDSI